MKQLVLHTDVLAASIAASHCQKTRTVGRDREFHYASMQDGGVGFDTMVIGFFTRSLCTPKAVLQYGLNL